MIFHDYLFHPDNCSILEESCLLLSEEVENRYADWMQTWEEDYMKFAEGSPSTQLYETYNVFLCPMHGFAELYNLIIKYFKDKEPSFKDYAVAGWVNVYRDGGYLDWHKHGKDIHQHDGRWHGYVCVNAEPSKTLYRNDNGLVKTIENQNGYITLSPAGMAHRTTPWNETRPRITIAFDFIKRQDIDPYNITRWIPII